MSVMLSILWDTCSYRGDDKCLCYLARSLVSEMFSSVNVNQTRCSFIWIMILLGESLSFSSTKRDNSHFSRIFITDLITCSRYSYNAQEKHVMWNHHCSWISWVLLTHEFTWPMQERIVCLFVIWRRHRCRWRAANFEICSSLMAIEQ